MRKRCFALCMAALLLLTACSEERTADPGGEPAVSPESAGNTAHEETTPTAGETEEESVEVVVEPYADIRYFEDDPGSKEVYEAGTFREEDIYTFTFNEGTVLEGSEELQAQIMEEGKNPGLGVRALHEQGITGEGVRVAIIDQNLLLDHPEFAGKIEDYYDTGCDQPADSGSMHAPGVTSLLVGESIGVAPGATVYFAAAPSWNGDSAYYADGLNWIVEQNEKLPEGEKIRVVSVSAAPSGEWSPFTKNLEMYDQAVEAAQAAGIVVLDCRTGEETGFIASAFFDPTAREDPTACTGGWPSNPMTVSSSEIGVPCSYRTVAEEYWEGEISYQYDGSGGQSWGIPYAAGVLALGWQVAPELDGETMLQLLKDSCATAHDGSRIIDPAAFIEAVREAHGQS